MKRHPLDILSLLLGLVFLAVALAYLVGQATGAIPSMLITMPLMLAGLGIAGLVGAVAAMQRMDDRVAAEAPVAVPAAPDSGTVEHAGQDTVAFPAPDPDSRES